MLIVALVLAVIGLASLVTAVVTSNELIAWVCIAASVLGVILLIIDAVRERQRGGARVGSDQLEASASDDASDTDGDDDAIEQTYQTFDADYPDDLGEKVDAAEVAEEVAIEETDDQR